MNKLTSSITFCKRLGKLTAGFDAVKDKLDSKEAKLILLASDLSQKTLKEIEYLCGIFEVPFYQTAITLDEYWYLIGKRSGVLAVTDSGFARKIQQQLSEQPSAT